MTHQRTAITAEGAPRVLGPYAQAVAVGDLVFCAGQVGLDPASGRLVPGGVEAETARVLENLAAVLAAAALGLGDIVKTTVYLVDTDSYQVETYPCPVYMPPFLHPELVGQDLRSLLRTMKHEHFAVATLPCQEKSSEGEIRKPNAIAVRSNLRFSVDLSPDCSTLSLNWVHRCWDWREPIPQMFEPLAQNPSRLATLVDLTCDSDGKVDRFISPSGTKNALELHRMNPGEPYYLGVFLVGAYQDILGDIHNLFGRVNEVHVFLDPDEELYEEAAPHTDTAWEQG